MFALALFARNDYLLFAGFVVLQYVVLATAWNILGGYCGYVNFGSAAFFAMGAYTTVALHKLGANPGRYLSDTPFEFLAALLPLSLPTLIVLGGVVSGIVGFGMGYLTLRLRGVFFAIATLAMAVVLQTIVINWDFVGGSRGAYVIRPDTVTLGPVSLTYIQYLFLLMLLLAVFALWVARTDRALAHGASASPPSATTRLAAEASGVPTLRLKLIATAVSGGADGHGRRAAALLHRLCRAGRRLRPAVRRQLHRHADDRRHHQLGRPAGRRHPARHAAADRHRHDLLGGEPPDRRRACWSRS